MGAVDIPNGNRLYLNNPLCVVIVTSFVIPPPVLAVDKRGTNPFN